MRKFLTKALVGAMMLGVLVVPASAATSAKDNFNIYINAGAVVSSKLAEKTASGMMWVGIDKQAGTHVSWAPSEKVNFRGRTPSGAEATNASYTYKPTDGEVRLGYLSGHGNYGSYYTMALHYDSNNPYTHLELTACWWP